MQTEAIIQASDLKRFSKKNLCVSLNRRYVMQRWKNSKIASGLMSLLGDSRSERDLDERMEAVRGAMLDELFDVLDLAAQKTLLFTKLKGACEIQTLWFLRSDLVHVLSEHMGESEAMQRVDALTQLFQGLVPKTQLISAQRRR